MEMFHVISLMDEAFRNHKLKYTVNETNEYQDIHVPFGIKNGPSVVVRYISHDRRNDVLVRIMNLVNNAPAEKRPRLLDVCNSLNTKFRFIKFTLDAENNLHIEYDFPTNSGDESIGEMAFEIFIRIMQILNEAYPVIATALYAREDETQPWRLLWRQPADFRLPDRNGQAFSFAMQKNHKKHQRKP